MTILSKPEDPKNFDPQLRAAIEEIKPILKKYDVMATVVLASPTHSEFLFEVETTWSLTRWQRNLENEIVGLRFRSKRSDFDSSQERHERTGATIHGLESLGGLASRIMLQITSVLKQLGQRMEITSDPTRFFRDPDSVVQPKDG